MDDNVNHPVHYTQGGIECIDALKASTETIAVMLYALHKSEGFGKARLNRLYQFVCTLGEYIHLTGNWYEDAVKWLKDEMGIGLNKGE